MKEMGRSSSVLLCLIVSLTAFVRFAMGKVVLMGTNLTTSFEDIEANFAPGVKGPGECGMFYVAEPLDACSPLIKKMNNEKKSPFVLIIRGRCSFEDKVRRAQAAGYKAAIIYNDEDGDLVAMAGNAAGIQIHAVFISKSSGETLTKYAALKNTQLCILPIFVNSAWSIMAIAFIALLAMSAVLATCFFIGNHTIRRERSQGSPARECRGMSACRVEAMPSLKFKALVTEESSTSATCAICLEDYRVGDKLRMLPCCHKFHAFCVDAWLTTWRTFCPVCKRDARTFTSSTPATESTPLLSSVPSSISSARSSLASSSAIQIAPSASHTLIQSSSIPRASYILSSSVSYTPYMHHSLQPLHLSASRSSIDISNTYYQRSPSPYSKGYPSASPLNTTRCMSPYIPSPMNGSSYVGSSYMGSSSRQQNPLHISESATSFSPFNSAISLPEC